MSSNTVRARLAFSFKGESYELDAVIDLDRCLGEAGEAPDFHQLLARAHGIDPYSYLYDAMESYEIEFSQPSGAAAHCCQDGGFDWPRFAQDMREARELQVIRPIAAQMLGVRDLDGQTDLKAALLAAYRAGRASEAAPADSSTPSSS